MQSSLTLGLLLAFFASLAFAVEQQRTVDIFAWPLSAPQSTTLAKVSYNSTVATVDSYQPFDSPADDDVVRVGFKHDSAGTWSGISTAASNFAAGKDKKLQLHVNANGDLYHVGFKASDLGGSHGKTKESKKGDLSVEIVPVNKGTGPALNKPIVVNQDGSMPDKVEEKSFFQKYWWAIAGFLLLQVVMGGAKGE
ncbi:hypothetical protein D0869_12090 [Hortaea werneckii]|uniref:DOMON domain-containing protein n=1 Tax=Hortaea werneckii TaxID=91943 RepID=A0A3M6W977_HORWE|nr:hypothetical protein KC334_g16332 [Hortaea werneckii]KAI7015387.1 hypothetical protein KC355_g4337 [Hortaea werneckii]KAI7137477.1 hypothetical protein KC324_g16598 [Hortaea werneckii]KAI7533808.1 hypothetical protein KC316_g16682 [Hortaea werneckii]KAI7651564.1 hypothetical protein KC318_g15608 [Hortaea werneckii]